MRRVESMFWGLVVVAGLYLLFGGNVASQKRADAQFARTGSVATQQAAPVAGCSMNGGGGCGCGGGGAINNPPGI